MSSRRHPSSMEYFLPDKIMHDVLSRLPVKSITQCKCVCKKWRDLVSDPYFVHLHLSTSREALIIHERSNIGHFLCKPGTLKWVEIEHEPDHYFLNPVKTLDLKRCEPIASSLMLQVGSVNGLICCRGPNDFVYIFNPVLEQYIILPQPQLNSVVSFYGFGVSTVGEYKVIRVCGRRVSLNPFETDVYATEIEVYTLGTGQWRALGPIPYQCKLSNGLVPVIYVKKSHLYWLSNGQVYDFDLVKETTSELLPLPETLGDERRSKEMLGVLKGRLSRIHWSSLGLEVWVMEEESWFKEIAIQEVISPILESQPLCLVDGLEGTSVLIVLEIGTNNLLAYFPYSNEILHLNLQAFFPRIMSYRPSFIKLDNFGSERVHTIVQQ